MNFKDIIEKFPPLKPCYEKITHNKVSKPCMLIPYGIKCYIWFTKYQNENICLLLELFNKKISKIYRIGLHYHSSLCNDKGTILFGTIFMNYKYKLKMISVENIFYKNKLLKNTFEEKIEIIFRLFKEEKIKSKNLMIGFPIMMNMDEVNIIDDYKVQFCQYQEGETTMKIPFKDFEKKVKNANSIFTLRCSSQNEIYDLFDENNDFVDVAFIPNYETSVMMNKLFKSTIKTLEEYEESDDEEDVKITEQVKMECQFHEKFKKWVPIKLA
jgi:hypothetical protein